MIQNHSILTYVHQNILIDPQADVKYFTQCLIAQLKRHSERIIKIRLHDYIKGTIFCDIFVNEIVQMLKLPQIQQKLANCNRLEIYDAYPDHRALLIWAPQASA